MFTKETIDFELLALYVIKQACIDGNDKTKRNEVEYFFRSEWCAFYLSFTPLKVTGEDIIGWLNKRIRLEV